MAKEIPTSKGKYTIVDDEDYEWLLNYKWHDSNDFVFTNIKLENGKYKHIGMHRILLGDPKAQDVVHINGNKHDNRRYNLRVSTKKQTRKSLVKDRLNQTGKNKFGSLMEVVEYDNADNILVKFINYGILKRTNWNKFINGNVRSPFDKSIYGAGYIGEGDYKVSENCKSTAQYSKWYGVMERCYSEKLKKKYLTYAECTISDEWLNFQSFAKWYDENFYKVDGEVMCLDKDILIKGNKIYSPETCVFVPDNINKLFIKRNVRRGSYPIGVHFNKSAKKYTAQCHNGIGKQINLGRYDTPFEAFQAYKIYKEQIIKQMADAYKDKMPNEVYEAMLKYEVDIND